MESCQNNDNKINVPLNVIISTDFQFWTLIRVEIIITINVENCTTIRANFLLFFLKIAVPIVIIVISTRVVFLRV